MMTSVFATLGTLSKVVEKLTITLLKGSSIGTTITKLRNNKRTHYLATMKVDSRSRYSAKIMFELPSNWQNLLSCKYHLCPYAHVWLVLFNGYSKEYFVCELTSVGITIDKVLPYEWSKLPDDSLNETTLCFDFQLTQQEYREIVERAVSVEFLPIQWSNWYVIPYLINGEFPTFTCSSLISYIVYNQFLELPSQLLEACEQDYLHNEFNTHDYDGY